MLQARGVEVDPWLKRSQLLAPVGCLFIVMIIVILAVVVMVIILVY